MPDQAETARWLLGCAEEHMGDVHGADNAATLAARAQAHATLAVAEAISDLTGLLADHYSH